MMNKCLILISLVFCTFLNADVYDKYKNLEDKAEQDAKDMNISSMIQKIDIKKYMKNAQNVYTKLKPLVGDEKKRIYGENNASMVIKQASKLQGNFMDQFIQKKRIYVFMSSSVPKSVWYEYGRFIYDNKILNASLLLRGCIGGCEKIKPTMRFMRSVVEYDEEHTINPSILIDPLLFQKYKINIQITGLSSSLLPV